MENIYKDLVDKTIANIDTLFKYTLSFRNVPMLLPIRNILLRAVLRKIFPFEKPNNVETQEFTIALFTKSPFYSVNKEFKFLFFTNNIDNKDVVNGKYLDVIHDYFALIYEEDSIIIQDSNQKNLREPRFFKNVCYNDYIEYKVSDIVKTKFLSYEDEKKIVHFCDETQKLFSELSKADIQKFMSLLAQFTIKLPVYYDEYTRLYEKINPSVLFLTEASYGIHVHKLIVAKDLSIPVVEFQHGMIALTEPAYNYSLSIIKSNDYSRFFPDYFLTFGEFWNTQIRISSKTRVIGCPHLTEKIKKINEMPLLDTSKRKILIVSQWTHTSIFVKIAQELAQKLSGDEYEIIFRPHPNETGSKNLYEHLKNLKNITIDESSDILDLLHKSQIVVSCFSTVIFESLAFGKIPLIFDDVWSNIYIPKNIGIRFKNIQELIEIIKNSSELKLRNDFDISYYWESNWRKNYVDFIENELRIDV